VSILDYNLEGYIQKLKLGDESVFDEIYKLTYRKIFFVVLPIVRDKALTEDIMQDTYLKFLEKLYDYKTNNSLAYILTIARNLALNEYNRRKREFKVEDSDMDRFSIDDHMEYHEGNKELIQSALRVLNTFEKNVFLLHVIENMRHREISMILDKPLGTITWTYQQAVKKMRKYLKDEEHEIRRI